MPRTSKKTEEKSTKVKTKAKAKTKTTTPKAASSALNTKKSATKAVTKKTVSTARKPRTTKRTPTYEEIAEQAYFLFLERGMSAEQNWIDAEKMLSNSFKKSKTKKK